MVYEEHERVARDQSFFSRAPCHRLWTWAPFLRSDDFELRDGTHKLETPITHTARVCCQKKIATTARVCRTRGVWGIIKELANNRPAAQPPPSRDIPTNLQGALNGLYSCFSGAPSLRMSDPLTTQYFSGALPSSAICVALTVALPMTSAS